MGVPSGANNREPFAMMPLSVLRDPGLSAAAKVLFTLLHHYSGHKQECWPSQEQLAADLGLNQRTIRALLQELEQAELLASTRRGRGMSNVYRLKSPDRQKTSGQRPMTGRKLPPRAEKTCCSRPEKNSRSLLGEQEPYEQEPLNKNHEGGEIPEKLNTAKFRDAWAKWEQHLREMKKPLTATTRRAQLDMLADLGIDEAVSRIDRSIRNGWQGLDYTGGTNHANGSRRDVGCGSRLSAPPDKYATKRTMRAGQASSFGQAAAGT
jgi:DNA-binding transcriptional ArsR family regulator